jgi:DNA-binding NarL/FixJ family response regulator
MDIVGAPRGAAWTVVGIATAVVVPAEDSSVAVSLSAIHVGGAALKILEAALAQGWVLEFPPIPADATEDNASCGKQPNPSLRPTPTDGSARGQRVLCALTQREREVLSLLAVGATNRAIASRLFISPKTASVHVSRILTKLDVSTRTEAAALAHASGLVRPEDIRHLAVG